MKTLSRQLEGAIIGLAIGDALGVPIEFLSRTMLDQNPVVDMRSGGTHGQLAGTSYSTVAIIQLTNRVCMVRTELNSCRVTRDTRFKCKIKVYPCINVFIHSASLSHDRD